MECLSNNDVSNILGNKSLCNKILKSWKNILRGKNKIILEEGNIKKGNMVVDSGIMSDFLSHLLLFP